MTKKLLLLMPLALFAVSSCSPDDDVREDVPFEISRTLYAGEKIPFPAAVGSWSTSNPLIASISDGMLKGVTVGNAVLTDETGNTAHVTVRGRYNIYEEPCIKFGCSYSDVKKYYMGKGFEVEDRTKGTELYLAAKKTSGIFYESYFKNGKYTEADIRILKRVTDDETMLAFLKERYLPISSAWNAAAFGGNNTKFGVILTIDNSLSIYNYEITYYPL